jgi:predicted transposase YbfD/YdcC
MIESCKSKKSHISKYRKQEKNKGRMETRTVWVFKATKAVRSILSHSQSVILVNREITRKGKKIHEQVLYISDLTLPAKKANDGIRGHWSIENKLHYVKDVVMNEDKSNMKNKSIASIISLLRSFTISLAHVFFDSVVSFQRTFAQDLSIIGLL